MGSAHAESTDDTWSRLGANCTADAFLKRNSSNTGWVCSNESNTNVFVNGTVSAADISISSKSNPAMTNKITRESFIRSWVKFAGSTAVVSSSFNVNTVARISAGRYVVAFSTPFLNNSYILFGNTSETTAGQTGRLVRAGPGVSYTTSTAIETVSSAGTPGDSPSVMAAWVGLQ